MSIPSNGPLPPAELEVERPFLSGGVDRLNEGPDPARVLYARCAFQPARCIEQFGAGNADRLGDVVGGDVGSALGLRRVRRKGRDRDTGVDRLVDRLDERVRLHRMQQDALRLFHDFLLEGRDLLGDVIVRRAGEGGLLGLQQAVFLDRS